MGRHAVYIVALGTDVASGTAHEHAHPPTVALLPWGDVFEDFLDPLGVTFEAFRDEFVGSWIFGYAAALAQAGVTTVVVCPTSRVGSPVAATHAPTGAELRLLPAPRLERVLSARRLDGRLDGRRDPGSLARAVATHLRPYAATPPRALAHLLRAERCDAVVCQEYEDPRFDVSVSVGRLLRIPVFGVFQGADYRNSVLERPLRPLAVRASTGLVVGAERERRRVLEAYALPAEKVAAIVNPVDVEVWRPGAGTAREELGIDAAATVVAWHGQVQLRRKGLDVLLEAWARVVVDRSGEDLHLVLVGTGEDARELRERVELSSTRGVHLVDEWVQDRERMRGFLAEADVYAFPSRHEGLPVSPLEALACGLPVVGADASGVGDVVGDAGVVVPCGDVEALASALDALVGDPARRADLGVRARERAERRFSHPAIGQELRAFLLHGGRH